MSRPLEGIGRDIAGPVAVEESYAPRKLHGRKLWGLLGRNWIDDSWPKLGFAFDRYRQNHEPLFIHLDFSFEFHAI